MSMDPMEFIKYDKISDDVYVLGPNVVLKFNVSLSKSSSGKRYHFYKEFEYGSHVSEPNTLVTIKRTFDYYLSLENVQKNKLTDEKAFIRIGVQDFYKFQNQIKEAVSWFIDKKYKSLFAKSRGGKITITTPSPESLENTYPQNKYIRISPVVIDKGEGNDKMEPGVELSLSSFDNYVIMNFDRLMGLYYTISTFNMYLAAQGLVNYLGVPNGMSRMVMGNGKGRVLAADEFVGETEGINDRIIKKDKNISSLE